MYAPYALAELTWVPACPSPWSLVAACLIRGATWTQNQAAAHTIQVLGEDGQYLEVACEAKCYQSVGCLQQVPKYGCISTAYRPGTHRMPASMQMLNN